MTNTDCIIWEKYTDADGYGTRTYQGKMHRAHRVAYYEAHGYWPNVCRHSCDTPACINPDHLLDGTHQDNANDRVARGRNGAWSGGPLTLNPDMPSQRFDRNAYMREQRLRKKAGTWVYLT